MSETLREMAEAEMDSKLVELVNEKESLLRENCPRLAIAYDSDIRELSVLRVRFLMRVKEKNNEDEARESV